MTYRYLKIRRETYEKCNENQLKSYRSFNDLKKLFKCSQWIILSLIIFSGIATCMICILPISKWFLFIPIFLTILLSIVSEFKFEGLYNREARCKEVEEFDKKYQEYLNTVKQILNENGINCKEKLITLKVECEDVLSKHENKYNGTKSKIYDMLIGVPLGALISALIYSRSDAIVPQIVAIIIIGVFVICLTSIVRRIIYYSDGYFKDKNLFDVLNEAQYIIE